MSLGKIPTGLWILVSAFVFGCFLVLAAAIFVSPQFLDGIAPVDSTRSAEATLDPNARKGLTWGKIAHLDSFDIDFVGCNTTSGPADSGGTNACDQVHGDTSCAVALPVLCIDTERLPRPAYALDSFGGSNLSPVYFGWTGGIIGLTPPVRGMDLGSLDGARKLCQDALGEGFRMAEHHDGRYVDGMGSDAFFGETWPAWDQLKSGGWSWFASGNISGASRFWVYINNQPGNCWDPASAE